MYSLIILIYPTLSTNWYCYNAW